MLYLIGLGLGDAKDITIKGLELVKKAERVYLEGYTSILSVQKDALEEFYGKTIIIADREMVEQSADQILEESKHSDVAFLVVGAPFGATTHSDLLLRAHEAGVQVEVVHNASIMNAVGCCGLQLYNFGETVSIVFWTESWQPDSFYDKILRNRKSGFHTLCLLDIKVKEQTVENLIKGRNIYEPPRFMTVNQAAQQLLEIYDKKCGDDSSTENLAYSPDTLCVGLARVGWPDQNVKVGRLKEFLSVDLGGPLHSMIIVGKTVHPLELDMLRINAIDVESFDKTREELTNETTT